MDKTESTQTTQPTPPAPPADSVVSKFAREAGKALDFAEDHVFGLFQQAGAIRAFVADGEKLAVELGARVKNGEAIEHDVRDLVSVLPGMTSNAYVKRICGDVVAALDADLAAQAEAKKAQAAAKK